MIKLICIGKIKERYIKDGIEDYVKRLSRYIKLDIIELQDSNKKTESLSIQKYIKDTDYVIVLDINGKNLSSQELADYVDCLFTNGNSNTVFIIGGSDGLDYSIINRSDYKLSFSNMTFPHQLFRLIFLEQLYRVFKILNNETYHK